MDSSVLLFIFTIGAILPVLGHDFSYTYYGQTLKYTVISEKDKTCKTMDSESYSPVIGLRGDVTIPSRVSDGTTYYTVTEIGKRSFYGCGNLTWIELPNTIKKIGEAAFYLCTNLTNFTIPEGVTTIERWAFIDCIKIERISVPRSLTTIGDGAFNRCTSLKAFDIPGNVTTVGSGAFLKCENLTEIMVPPSVTSLGEAAFMGCTNLKKAAYPIQFDYKELFNTDVAKICYDSKDAFLRSNGFLFNADQTKLLYAPLSFTGEYTIRENVEWVGPYVFAFCDNMTSIKFPETLLYISIAAFKECTSLKSVELPSKINALLDSAFYGCNKINTLSLGNGDKLYTICNNAFSKCSALKELTIPESVTVIEREAFEGCTALKTVNFGSRVRSIFESAFSGCGIVALSLPRSLKLLKAKAFYKCPKLTTLRIEDEVEEFGNDVWGECLNIKDITYCSLTPIAASQNIFASIAYDQATLHVPDGSMRTFLKLIPWNYFMEIEDDIEYSGVHDIMADGNKNNDIDYSLPYIVCNLHGVYVGDTINNLSVGVYIIRQGKKSKKIRIH